MPKWLGNFVICFAFPHSSSGTDRAVAVLANGTLRLRCKYTLEQVAGSAKADRAAVGVAEEVGLDKEVSNLAGPDQLASCILHPTTHYYILHSAGM